MTPNSVLLFGDSITASYSFVQSPGASGSGWFNGAQALSVRPFGTLYPINSGVSGNTTAQMLSRLAADVYSFSPRVVHVLGGFNDIGVDSRAATLILADLEAICDGILADGADAVILGTIYPADTMQTETKRGILNDTNTGIRSYAAATDGVTLVDYNAAMAADGVTLDDAGYIVDTVHPSKLGNAVMAQTLAPVMRTVAASLPT